MEGATRGRYYVGATRCVQRTGQEDQSQDQDQLSTGGGAGWEAEAPRIILPVHLCLPEHNQVGAIFVKEGGSEHEWHPKYRYCEYCRRFFKKLLFWDSLLAVSESRQNLIVCNRRPRVVQVLICCLWLTAVPQACV